MGFRFRKSVKIAPGVRMNVSKSGVGFSAGVKGARVSTGPRGTHLTTSIPGTGISYQTKLSKKKKRSSSTRYQTLAQQQKEQDKLAEIEQNKLTVEESELYLELVRSFRKDYSEPIDWVAISEGKHLLELNNQKELAAAQDVKDYKPTWRDILFGRTEFRRNQLLELVEEAKQLDIAIVENAKQKQQLANSILNFDLTAYEEVLEDEIPFDDILEIGAQINYNVLSPTSISFEIDIKSKDTVPTTKLSLTKTGKISERNMTKTQYFDIYQDFISSIAIRLGRDGFNLLPLRTIYVHVNDQIEIDGILSVGAVISVKFEVDKFNSINFETCDCSDTIETFEHNMNFKKTKGLNLVTRLSEEI